MAEERRFYAGFLFSESEWEDNEETRCGTSLVKLDSVTSCHALYYQGNTMKRPIYMRHVKNIEDVTQLDSTKDYCSYLGRSIDGTYFVEKQFYNRPVKEGILFYQIPKQYYEKVAERLGKQWYLPMELFQDSLYRLMEYKLTGVSWNRYEEGRLGGALVNLGYAKSCVAFYFNGAMMGTPLYVSQIEDVEYVTRSDSSQYDNKYSSRTGRMDYGKASDGTYFVEKLFYDNLLGLSQGIILFKIPEEYYEEVLLKLCSLPCLPSELFGVPK